MSKEAKLVLVLNDTHCGSELGLHPEKVKLGDGRVLSYGDNAKLKFLWQSWSQMTADFFDLAGNDPYIFVANGDLVEGFHHGNDKVVAAQMSQHVDIAQDALSPFIEMAEEIFVTRGTECHTGDWEQYLCDKLDLPKAKDFHQFRVNGVLMDARHHMACASSPQMEANAMGKLITEHAANCNRAGYETPRIFFRAHRHLTGDYCDGHSMVIVPAAWQFMSRYCYKKVGESVPRFSAYALDFRDTRKNALPIVHRYVYTPPLSVLQ